VMTRVTVTMDRAEIVRVTVLMVAIQMVHVQLLQPYGLPTEVARIRTWAIVSDEDHHVVPDVRHGLTIA
jgi:hypothetical protein